MIKYFYCLKNVEPYFKSHNFWHFRTEKGFYWFAGFKTIKAFLTEKERVTGEIRTHLDKYFQTFFSVKENFQYTVHIVKRKVIIKIINNQETTWAVVEPEVLKYLRKWLKYILNNKYYQDATVNFIGMKPVAQIYHINTNKTYNLINDLKTIAGLARQGQIIRTQFLDKEIRYKVHNIISHMKGVNSRSKGEDKKRYVLIVPKKKKQNNEKVLW